MKPKSERIHDALREAGYARVTGFSADGVLVDKYIHADSGMGVMVEQCAAWKRDPHQIRVYYSGGPKPSLYVAIKAILSEKEEA